MIIKSFLLAFTLKSAFIICAFIFGLGILDRYINFYEFSISGHSGYSLRPIVQNYRNFIKQNQDLGSSFTIYNNSVRVLDLVGGYADLEHLTKWDKSTVSQLFMTSHLAGISAITLFIDRGLLNYDTKLGNILPTIHKSLGNITIREVLTHETGIPYLEDSLLLADYRDSPLAFIEKFLKSQQKVLNFPVIHKYTQGIILDAIVRKIDRKSRSLALFFSEEIAYQKELDILIGLPRTQFYRNARIYVPSIRQHLYAWGQLDIGGFLQYMRKEDIVKKTENTFTEMKTLGLQSNIELLEIPLASSHVFTSSDALAKLLSFMFLSSPFQIIDNQTVAYALKTSNNFYDPHLQDYVSMTNCGLMKISVNNIDLYGWRDPTGQFAWVAPSLNMSVAYVTNHLRAISPKRDYIFNTLLSATLDAFRV